VRTYEVTFRFRTDVEPRVEITTEQVADRIVPYVFPRHGGQVVVLGSTITRIDNEREADRGNQT
jgi:hypothetical protein